MRFQYRRHGNSSVARARPRVRAHAFFGIIALAALLPAWLLAGYMAVRHAQSQREILESDARNAAHIISSALEREVTARRASLVALASSASLMSGDIEGFARELAQFRLAEGEEVVLRGLNDQIVIGSRHGFTPQKPVAPLGGASTNILSVSDLFRSDTDGSPIVSVSLGVEVPDGAHPGLEPGVYSLSLETKATRSWSTTVARARLPLDWIGAVIDSQDTILARWPSPETRVGLAGSANTIAAIRGSGALEGWVIGRTIEGRAVYVAFRKLQTPNWVTTVSVPADSVDRLLWQTILPVGLGGLSLLLLTLSLIGALSRSLAGPLERLSEAAEEVGRGGLPAEYPPWCNGPAELFDVWMALRAAATQRRADDEALRRLAVDLDQQVQARTAQLAESEARFRGIFDSSLQIVALLSPEGGVVESNRTSLTVAGAEVSAVIGRPLWEAPPWSSSNEATKDRLRSAVARAAGGAVVRQEEEVEVGEGKKILLDFSITPIFNPEGDVIFLVPEGRDITERRAIEAQLAQAQKMDAIGRLTGGVSHDFNNLLQAASGHLDLLEAKARRAGTEELSKHIGSARAALDRMARLTTHLLAFSRKQPLAPRPIDVRECVLAFSEDVLSRALSTRHAPGVTIALKTELPAGLPPISADKTQLETAVLNLAVNAADAMPEGGTIVISATRESLTAPPDALDAPLPGEYIRLTVEDNGSGMPPEVMSRAFEPFFTTKVVGQGTGLGLSQVFGFARQSGGTARIESEQGLGTRVHLLLPCVSPEHTS